MIIYPGLPVNPDIEEMMMVWEKAEKNNIKLNSPTLLASLLRFLHFLCSVYTDCINHLLYQFPSLGGYF